MEVVFGPAGAAPAGLLPALVPFPQGPFQFVAEAGEGPARVGFPHVGHHVRAGQVQACRDAIAGGLVPVTCRDRVERDPKPGLIPVRRGDVPYQTRESGSGKGDQVVREGECDSLNLYVHGRVHW